MSAFVVEPKIISRVLSRLDSKRDDSLRYTAERILNNIEFSLDDLHGLGQAMYNLNVNAVGQRYPDSKGIDDLPGCYSDGEHLDKFTFVRQLSVPVIWAYKALQCWLYQCAEGNVTETKLYKAFREIQATMADSIIYHIPEYESAPWG